MSDERQEVSERRSTRLERADRLSLAAELTGRDDPSSIFYQHTVLCQTGLPYRDPGAGVLEWERVNGRVHMAVTAGKVMHPIKERLVHLGLPYGPKPRLILAHLNAEALRQQSPEIEVDASLTAFVRRLKLDTGGRTMGSIKEQLARLSAAHITLGTLLEGRSLTINSQIVTAFDLWFPKEEGNRVLWPSTLRLSADYFDSLAKHAVPLHDAALVALSGNAMALDLYAWLAQRLHRVDPAKPVLIPWPMVREQFGWGYEQLTDFRKVFRRTLGLVLMQYRAARVEVDRRGLMLLCSSSPVQGRTAVVVQKTRLL